MSKTVHVGYHVLCHILLNSTSDVVLGMDWLNAINPLINLHDLLLSLVCRGEIVRIFGTKYDCFYASFEVLY